MPFPHNRSSRAFYLQRPEPIHLVKGMVTAVVPATNQGKDVSSGAEKQQIQTKYLQKKMLSKIRHVRVFNC